MKTSVKLLSLLLSLLLLFPLSACSDPAPEAGTGDGTADDAGTNTEETEEDRSFITDLGNTDLGGTTFTFLVQSDPCFVHFYDVNVTDYNDGVINQAVYTRNRTVESMLHIKIEDVNGGGDASAPDALRRSVSTGDGDYDAAWLKTHYFFATTLEGCNLNLDNIPNLDLSKLYWDQNAQEDYLMCGKLYGMMGDISTTATMFTHLFGINKIVANEHGIELSEIYEKVLNGDWTLDAFREYCAMCEWSDLNGNGKCDGLDQFAFGTSPSLIFGGFSASGEKWIVKDEDGEYVLSELSDRKVDVLQSIVDICNDQNTTVTFWNIGSIPGVTDTYGYVYRTKFENNTILFSDLDMGEVLDTRATMKDDFGIVPLPKFDKTQDNYSVYAYQFFPLLSIPSSIGADRWNVIGYTLEVLASESYKTLTPAFYDIAMGGMVLRDEMSVKMLDIILRSRRYELLTIYQWANDSFYNSLQNMLMSGKCNIANTFAKSSRSLENAIKEVRKKTEALK